MYTPEILEMSIILQYLDSVIKIHNAMLCDSNHSEHEVLFIHFPVKLTPS